MRARPQTQIVPAAPDMQVMAGTGGDVAGVVGHLIGLEPGRFERLLRGLIEFGGQILVRRRPGPARHRPPERRRPLDGQLIRRDVLEPQIEGGGQFRPPVDDALPRPGVDQVDRQARERPPRQTDRPARLLGRMVAAQKLQRRVVKRLHPHRQPVDACLRQSGVTPGLGVGRIGLKTDLYGAGRREQGVGALNHRRHSVRRHQRRRASAEEDRGQRARADPRRLRLQVVKNGLRQPRLLLGPPPVAHDVEVAIGADARAVGPVDVEGDGVFFAPIAALAERGCLRGERLNQSAPP
ncbi:hypothetical protein ACMZ4W_01804 [Brevundimonas naejangsanensis]